MAAQVIHTKTFASVNVFPRVFFQLSTLNGPTSGKAQNMESEDLGYNPYMAIYKSLGLRVNY